MVNPITPISPSGIAAGAAASTGTLPPDALQPGATVVARVVALMTAGEVDLAIGNAIVRATTQIPLQLGAAVQFAVRSTPEGLALQLLGPADGSVPAAPSGMAASASPLPATGTSVSLAGSLDTPATIIATTSQSIAVGTPQGPAAPAIDALRPADTSAPSLQSVPTAADMASVVAAVRNAAVAQNGMGPLFADLAAAVNLPALPEPVVRAALRLLSQRPALDDELSAADLKQAFGNSGLFLEARLAGSDVGAEAAAGVSSGSAHAPQQPPADGTAMLDAAPSMDLKAALLMLRSALSAALIDDDDVQTSGSAPAAGAAPGRSAGPPDIDFAVASPSVPPPPPYRGAAPAMQPAASVSIDSATPPRVAVNTLMAETDAALARQTLLQAASLPVIPNGVNPADGNGSRWHFEVPFGLLQPASATTVVPFEIARDGQQAARPSDGSAPAWRARFSINLDPIGPVHAQVWLRGGRAGVVLWAERPESAARLMQEVGTLADALRNADLEAGELSVRSGAPGGVGGRSATVPAGHFLDRAS